MFKVDFQAFFPQSGDNNLTYQPRIFKKPVWNLRSRLLCQRTLTWEIESIKRLLNLPVFPL